MAKGGMLALSVGVRAQSKESGIRGTMARRANRFQRGIDANQKEISEMLEKAGLSVCDLSMVGKGCADILVGGERIQYGIEANLLVELKTDEKKKLTEDQEKFHRKWRGPIMKAWSGEQILEWFGRLWEG
jgi:hypothetical protein